LTSDPVPSQKENNVTTINPSLVRAFLCLFLLVGSAFAATPATELLYVQQGQNVVTYSVNTKTAVTKKLGTLTTKFEYVVSVNRSGSFIYILGFTSATAESFSVYPLTSAGVPTTNPVQTLVVKPALTQFVIHPSGKFAYAEYSWEDTSAGSCQGAFYETPATFCNRYIRRTPEAPP
jgi:hypothetical protein